MKVNITLDGTPDEVRAFFGWPPVAGLHEQWQRHWQEQLQKGLPIDTAAFTPAGMGAAGLSDQLQQFMTMQQAFWQQMNQQGDKR